MNTVEILSNQEGKVGSLCYTAAVWPKTFNTEATGGRVPGRTPLLNPGISEPLATHGLVSTVHSLQSFVVLWSTGF